MSTDFRATKQWEKFIPYVIPCPLIPIFPTPYVEAILSNESVQAFSRDIKSLSRKLQIVSRV